MKTMSINLTRLELLYKALMSQRGIHELGQTRPALKTAELIHRVTLPYRYPPMQEARRRFKTCTQKKPAKDMKWEIQVCWKYWHCYPLYYFRYNLYRNDIHISDDDLIDYIPLFFFYYLFLPYYNKKEYEHIISDKHLTEELFRTQNIPQPPTIAKYMRQQFLTADLKHISFSQILKDINEKQYQKIFVKPIKGRGGHGIYIFNRIESKGYITNNNESFTESFFRQHEALTDYIIQPGVEQDPELSRIYSSSINTFRIMTEYKQGKVRVLQPVFLRVGRSGLQVDNYDQNGLLLSVDRETGELGTHAISAQQEAFDIHPDTHFQFKGRRISHWKDIREVALASARKIPQMGYIGWDIALTTEGPIVIEANPGTGLDGLQIHSGGLRKMFDIQDPQFYWENRGYR